MTRSEAERKDSGTFLCPALSGNPTNNTGLLYVSEAEKLEVA